MDAKVSVKSIAGSAIKSRTAVTVCLFLLVLVYAISFTMIGPMMPTLINEYTIRVSEGGLISTFQSIGGVLAFILGGIFADRMKKSKFLGISFGIYVVSLLLISLAPIYMVLLCLFFVLGVSTNLVDILANAYLSDLYQEKRGMVLNLLHSFFGVGAFIGPLFSSILIQQGIYWNIVFRILGVMCIVVLILFSIILRNAPGEVQPHSRQDKKNILKFFTISRMWILCIIMLLYAAHQYGVNTWLPMYMETSLGSSNFLSSLGLSVFWIGIILGRLTCSRLSLRFTPRQLIMWGGLIGGIILTLGILMNSPVVLIITSGLSGLLTGAFIPLLITIGCEWYPQNSGAISSILFLNSTLSRMLFPWLIGIIAEVFNFRLGMLITSVSLVITFFVATSIREE